MDRAALCAAGLFAGARPADAFLYVSGSNARSGDLVAVWVKNGFELIVNLGPVEGLGQGGQVTSFEVPAEFDGTSSGAKFTALAVPNPDAVFSELGYRPAADPEQHRVHDARRPGDRSASTRSATRSRCSTAPSPARPGSSCSARSPRRARRASSRTPNTRSADPDHALRVVHGQRRLHDRRDREHGSRSRPPPSSRRATATRFRSTRCSRPSRPVNGDFDLRHRGHGDSARSLATTAAAATRSCRSAAPEPGTTAVGVVRARRRSPGSREQPANARLIRQARVRAPAGSRPRAGPSPRR